MRQTPFQARLKELMHQRGVSMRALSLQAGMNETAVKAIMAGRSDSPRGQTIAALARVLDVPVSDLMDAAAASPPPEPDAAPTAGDLSLQATASARSGGRGSLTIPEYDVRPSGGVGSAEPPLNGDGNHFVVAQWQLPADFLRANTPNPEAVRIVRVVGDSMEPDFPPGDRVAVDTSHTTPSPPGIYVLWDGFGLVLKRLELIIGPSPRRLRLSSTNAAYQPYECPVEDVHINGRVLGKWVWR